MPVQVAWVAATEGAPAPREAWVEEAPVKEAPCGRPVAHLTPLRLAVPFVRGTSVQGLFTPTGSMTKARWLPTATLLPSGKVLIAGGLGYGNFALASAEAYDPVAGAFTATGSMTTGRQYHTATLLPSGKVLIVGGSGDHKVSLARLSYTTQQPGPSQRRAA